MGKNLPILAIFKPFREENVSRSHYTKGEPQDLSGLLWKYQACPYPPPRPCPEIGEIFHELRLGSVCGLENASRGDCGRSGRTACDEVGGLRGGVVPEGRAPGSREEGGSSCSRYSPLISQVIESRRDERKRKEKKISETRFLQLETGKMFLETGSFKLKPGRSF